MKSRSVILIFSLIFFAKSSLASEPFSTIWWEEPWYEQKSHKQDLYLLRKILTSTKQGKKLVDIAEAKEPNFFQTIQFGANSVTETIFSRSFSLEDVKENIVSKNHLLLNKNLSRKDLVLDLSHELTHYLFRKPHNPYSYKISLEEFVRDGIEGKGGEIDAFASECLVAWELEESMNLPRHGLCKKYFSKNGFSYERAKNDYYAIGRYFQPLKEIQAIFPELSGKEIVFSSSLQKVPYPIAFIEEFASVRNTACKNNRKKANLIAQYSARLQKNRRPTSQQPIRELSKEYEEIEKFLHNNCKKENAE